MEKSYRIGAAAVIFAVLLRIGCSSLPQKTLQLLQKPEVIRLLLFAETGRWLELPRYRTSHSAESAAPVFAQAGITFCQEDAQLVDIQNVCGLETDIPTLLTRELNWKLYGAEPTVLILHSHASESYTYTGGYTEDTAYRTLDEDHNMLSVGDALAQQLQQAGICVLHDRTLHDYPSYNGSYTDARGSMDTFLKTYPGIELVLDLHRDAVEAYGRQLRPLASDGETAQMMLVMGTNYENWEANLSLALKLHALLEESTPGIMRPLQLRPTRFNQDLSSGAVLIEVGAAGNTHAEAMKAAEKLANAIIALAKGTE